MGNDITNEYLFLDMHGYHEDKINTQKGRKETFRNTTEDAFHAAFASMCNFYITNDNKSYNKTKQVYEKLQTNTLVLKPNKFVEYYNKYLNINNKQTFIQLIFTLLEKGKFVEDKLDGALLRTCYFPFFIFDFFNKLMILIPDNNEECSIILSQNMHSNGDVYSMEITKLVSDMCEVFGNDIENLGEVQEGEFQKEEWIGRKWKFENITFKLIRLNRRFQIYLLFDELV